MSKKLLLIPVYGLANRMRAIESAIQLSKKFNLSLTIKWVCTPQVLNCRFDNLFQPIQEINIVNKKNVGFLHSEPFSYHYPKYLYYISNYYQRLNYDRTFWQNDFDSLKEFHKQKEINENKILIESFSDFTLGKISFSHFKPLPFLQHEIDKKVSKLGSNSVGIHIRRTDNKKSIEASPISLFEKMIINEIEINQDVKFYLSSDDDLIKETLYNKYPEYIITERNKTDRNTVEGIQEALIDLYTLSRTSRMIGSYWSSFSEVASQINGIPLTIITKDNFNGI
jgi:hypothetical protein